MRLMLILLIPVLALASTSDTPKRQPWGKVANEPGQPAQEVYLMTLKNKNGMEVAITNYGARVVSITAPDRNGHYADVVLGYDSLAGYENKNDPFFGAIVGRYANRIAKGQFTLDGHTYHLPLNDGPNSLHGGDRGFDKRVWEVRSERPDQIVLHYLSKDGEEGYPGDLNVTVTYTLTGNNELKIDYVATTDKDTVLNLSNHSYFNLAGQGNGTILGQQMMINADKFTPIDSTSIPTGEIKAVAGTPFDFRKSTAIGARINEKNQQLENGKGYDHNFVLNEPGKMRLAARATDPGSGRVLEVLTDQPGVQFYTGNFLDGTIHGKQGKVYAHRGAFCLETQHFPDSPNHPNFPSTELKPGQKFHSTTIFRFTVEK